VTGIRIYIYIYINLFPSNLEPEIWNPSQNCIWDPEPVSIKVGKKIHKSGFQIPGMYNRKSGTRTGNLEPGLRTPDPGIQISIY
jgi:hypothetical protein